MASKQVGFWLQEDTIVALQDEARQRGMKYSELAEELLRAGLEDAAARRLEVLALPDVEKVVQKVVHEQACATEERLVALLVRILLETGVARRVSWATLAKTCGRDHAVRVNEAAFAASAHDLMERGWLASAAEEASQDASMGEEV